jgi:hypothetical protein
MPKKKLSRQAKRLADVQECLAEITAAVKQESYRDAALWACDLAVNIGGLLESRGETLSGKD